MYHQLLICYRQLNDPVIEFKQLLEDVRNGEWNEGIIVTLETKLGLENKAKVETFTHGSADSRESDQFVTDPCGSLIIVLTRKRRDVYNNYHLKKNSKTGIYAIHALDGMNGMDEAEFRRADPVYDMHFKNRPALMECAVGAPVRMARKTRGKMSDLPGEVTVPPGAIGIIVGFDFALSDDVRQVHIHFIEAGERPACDVSVGRVPFEISEFAPVVVRERMNTRLQFPFDLAYAVTLTSFQGGEARLIVFDLFGYGLGWLQHSPYTGISRGTWGPGLKCINIPRPREGININAISKDMIELDNYFDEMRAKEEAHKDITKVVSFDIISRLQVCF